MRRQAVAAAAALAALVSAPIAVAEPSAPQPGSPCDAALVGGLTTTADATLECAPQGWRAVSTPTPSSDTWVSLGPPVKVHGNGLRNPQLQSGEWTGTPLDPGTRCTVQQVPVLRGVGAGPPEDLEGERGQPLSFTTPELVFSIEFGGACLWQRR